MRITPMDINANWRTAAQQTVVALGVSDRDESTAVCQGQHVFLVSSETFAPGSRNDLSADCDGVPANIFTKGVNWTKIPIRARFKLGCDVLVEICRAENSGGGKADAACVRGKQIMPPGGAFVRVLKGGIIRCGDRIAPTYFPFLRQCTGHCKPGRGGKHYAPRKCPTCRGPGRRLPREASTITAKEK